MSDDLTRRGFLGTAALAAAGTTLPDVGAQSPQTMLGTGGRPNLMVIEDYNAQPRTGTLSVPVYRFELHMSIGLKSATVANKLRVSLANGKVGEIEKHIIDDGGGYIELSSANIPKLRKLLQAIYQAPP